MRTFRLLIPFVLALALLIPGAATAVSITIAGPTTGPLTSGTGSENPGGAAQITFTIGLDAQTAIQGYDLTLRWDPAELDLVAAQPLFSDTGSVVPFVSDPFGSTPDPAGLRIASFPQFASSLTTGLFNVTFDILSRVDDGAPDVSVLVALANGPGISPPPLAIDNPSGAGIDVVPEPTTALLLAAGLAGLALRRP